MKSLALFLWFFLTKFSNYLIFSWSKARITRVVWPCLNFAHSVLPFVSFSSHSVLPFVSFSSASIRSDPKNRDLIVRAVVVTVFYYFFLEHALYEQELICKLLHPVSAQRPSIDKVVDNFKPNKISSRVSKAKDKWTASVVTLFNLRFCR